MTRLSRLRERARSKQTPEFDAALTAAFLAGPGWFLAHGLTGRGWSWAALALVLGILAMGLGFLLLSALLESWLDPRRAETASFALTCAAAAFWCFPRYGVYGLLPVLGGALIFTVTLLRSRPAPADAPAEALLAAAKSLPAELPPQLGGPVERALADHERIEETLRDELKDDAAIDATALRAGVAAAMQAMLERARLSARLFGAAGDGGSEKLKTAAAEARAQVEALGEQVHGAAEALLLYAAARQPAGADELRARAQSLRATTASLREIAAMERA